MKILKAGKVEQRKFVCPDCGCEFAVRKTETLWTIDGYRKCCPTCYERHDWDSGEPYEEPVKHRESDAERLTTMLQGIRLNSEVWSWAGIARHLVSHGVTFREE